MNANETAYGVHCSHGALTGSLGLIVQFILAFIAFGALIVKRFCEPKDERRPWIIWFYDTSKQATGAALIHFSNVFLAELFHGDPCTWYVISFLLDSTVGLLIICLGLKLSLIIIKQKKLELLVFGNYGHSRQCRAWLSQCGVYLLIVFIEKILMTLLLLFEFWKNVTQLILSPIRNPNLELVLVMFIIPLIVNAIIFWVVDNYLKETARKAIDWSAINSNEQAARYLTAYSFGKRYAGLKRERNSESEELLSVDDEDGGIPKEKFTFAQRDHVKHVPLDL